jgi:uncharacterized membrane protein
MFPFWLLIAVAAGFSSNLFNFSSRHYLRKKKDSTAFAWLLELVRTIIYICILPFAFHFVITPYSLLIFFLLSLSETLSVYFTMKMHEHSHLSLSTIISRTKLIWVALISFLFFGEKLSTFEYASIALLMVGLLIITSPKKITGDKGVKYAHFATFFAALDIIFLKAAAPFTTATGAAMIMGILSIILLPIFMHNRKTRIKKVIQTLHFRSAIPIIANTSGSLLLAWALSLGVASIVTGIYQGMMVFSVLGGIILLKEHKDTKRKLLGCVIALVAIILLTFK